MTIVTKQANRRGFDPRPIVDFGGLYYPNRRGFDPTISEKAKTLGRILYEL